MCPDFHAISPNLKIGLNKLGDSLFAVLIFIISTLQTLLFLHPNFRPSDIIYSLSSGKSKHKEHFHQALFTSRFIILGISTSYLKPIYSSIDSFPDLTKSTFFQTFV